MTMTFSAAVRHDTPMQFPAGEQHFKDADGDSQAPYVVIRGTNAEEYISAAMWIDMQHQRGHKAAAIIPYLPGARQDRGIPFGAEVYASMINNVLRADQVIYFDPHSEIMPGMIDNGTRVEVADVIEEAIEELPNCYYDGVIAPDTGAARRAQMVGNVLGVPVYTASKKRNPDSGKLSDFQAPSNLPGRGHFLVVDDICDGGGTFLGLVEAIDELVLFDGGMSLDLWVSHGVFSGGPVRGGKLNETFDRIITTNSHPGHINPFVRAHIFDIIPTLVDRISL